ncbi:shikimate kinase [Sphingomonas spermidinifaciens]|uniref:Shikimate kinase n=1 Tax=Sphingomonas spermidinifaciens TaxID=1141889 RepID=A0A2A4AXU4_9SPHN|nr:shikimate kinase [Sphingomonas spermidinifaciens]PCD01763.1 shikimate kinase [Sphingomonas spermidinifaciens]
MTLLLLHGPPASGKLTIGRIVAERTGFALFHNHLVVDAVTALFPFGSEPFVRLREATWLALLGEAAAAGRDTIFTFAPEPTVTQAFIPTLAEAWHKAGRRTLVVALTIDVAEQERRLVEADRRAFGKLTDVELLRGLRSEMAACGAVMPPADLTIDTGNVPPDKAASRIVAAIG